jgi:uncharacterized protein YceH (UPF0502 family)
MNDQRSQVVTDAKQLTPHQRRVLGVLIEKAKTTPAGYPMTVNAIVAGCNQKNNRDPITAYDDVDVSNTLVELQSLGVVKEIDWMGRVPKYKHQAYEWLGVNPAELAVLTELLLRGAQALGELRARASRMEPIEDLNALKPIVEGLIGRKLMLEMTGPGRGQIVTHNLYAPGELATLRDQQAGPGARHAPNADSPAGVSTPRAVATHVGTASVGDAPDIAHLVSGIAELRAQVSDLADRVRKLESGAG